MSADPTIGMVATTCRVHPKVVAHGERAAVGVEGVHVDVGSIRALQSAHPTHGLDVLGAATAARLGAELLDLEQCRTATQAHAVDSTAHDDPRAPLAAGRELN